MNVQSESPVTATATQKPVCWRITDWPAPAVIGLANYRDCGNGLKVDLVTQPEMLANDAFSARSAAWFFTTTGCLKYPGDLTRVTQIINSGQNGIDDRRARFLKAKSVLVG